MKTCLYNQHIDLGGRMVAFAGWEMPVEYQGQGLRVEHKNVRENVGLFDVSHMGEIRICGAKALESLEWLTSNSVEALAEGRAQYSLLTNFEGGIVDDLIIYCFKKGQDYLLCVNASNKDKDLKWVQENNKGADIIDESSRWGQIAVQGPKAIELLGQVFEADFSETRSFSFVEKTFNGKSCYVAMTGYTGEAGSEVFVPWESAAELWTQLMAKGEVLGVMPIGLGARDTLRTEMKYSLYGNEIDDHSNPYEAGLGWVVKPKKKDFIGKDKILSQKPELSRKLVGFKMLEKGIPRKGYKLFSFDNTELGWVTSGTLSPSLNENIGIGYVHKDFSKSGLELNVEIRNRRVKAEIVETPFVKN